MIEYDATNKKIGLGKKRIDGDGILFVADIKDRPKGAPVYILVPRRLRVYFIVGYLRKRAHLAKCLASGCFRRLSLCSSILSGSNLF